MPWLSSLLSLLALWMWMLLLSSLIKTSRLQPLSSWFLLLSLHVALVAVEYVLVVAPLLLWSSLLLWL
jgi:hypothetical protein